MVQADIYFLSLLFRTYEGQNLIIHLSNGYELKGFVGKLSTNHSVVEISNESPTKRYISLCEIIGVESTNGIPLALPRRSGSRYEKIVLQLSPCAAAMNAKAYELHKVNAIVSIFAAGEVAENVHISDIVPGLIAVNNQVFVTAKIIELQHVLLE